MNGPRYDLIQQNNSDARTDREIKQLTADWERLKEACLQRDDQIERLRRELTEARQVLNWYADESNYDDFDTDDPDDHGEFWEPAAIGKDRGERARQSLTSNGDAKR